MAPSWRQSAVSPRGTLRHPRVCVGASVLHMLLGVRRHGHRLVQLLDALDGIVNVGLDLDHPPSRLDFHHIVGEVGDGHELGQRRPDVTAPFWYPKLWVKFSLFVALHHNIPSLNSCLT